jgi:hypothetical protein
MATLNGQVSIGAGATLAPPGIQVYADHTLPVGGSLPIKLAGQPDGTYAQVYQAVDTAAHAVAVTTSNTVNLVAPSKSIWVGGVGDLTVLTVGGETVTFTAVPAGTRVPIQALRVLSTGTTATLIVALW